MQPPSPATPMSVARPATMPARRPTTPLLVSPHSFWNTPRMTTPLAALVLQTGGLSVADVVAVARGARRVELGDASRRAVLASRGVVDAALKDALPLYGI